jgi:AraC-like DNA-binding protein
MRPTVYVPAEDLAEYVECFWTMEAGEEDIGSMVGTFANCKSGFLFQHCDGRSGLGPPGAHENAFTNGAIPTSLVYGKCTAPSHTFINKPVGFTGVVFRAQALSTLLHLEPADLTNAPVILDNVSRDGIAGTLIDACSRQERLAFLTEFLRARVDRARPEDRLVAEGIRLMHREIRSVRLPKLLKSLKMSERQFERRFIRATGVSPHQYIRVSRFQEALRLMRTARFSRLSDLAYHLSYSDQSHFIKDIKEFSGFTPRRLCEIVRTCIDLPCGLIPARPYSDPDVGSDAEQSIEGDPLSAS